MKKEKKKLQDSQEEVKTPGTARTENIRYYTSIEAS